MANIKSTLCRVFLVDVIEITNFWNCKKMVSGNPRQPMDDTDCVYHFRKVVVLLSCILLMLDYDMVFAYFTRETWKVFP